MNWADYFIIGVLGLSVMIGLWRGLVSELLALAIWVAAFWVAWVFGPSVAAGLESVIGVPSIRIVAGYGLCFIAVLVLGALLRFVVGRLIASTGLSGLDRLLGMMFGLARGVLLVALMVFLVGFTALTRDSWYRQSVLLPQVEALAVWLGQRVPPDIGAHFHADAVLDKLPRLPLPGVDPAHAGSAAAPSATMPAPATSARPAAANAGARR